ncbi:MAG: 2-amino-4-hydroxy-6-hydroxymethyldihydropteridine diphosphokinase [Betaproteobacteria bacterium]|nr:2-amino-4-hydroxy-6-hydroxymethyldihydropteridine diphosphokinase [Betaproteobacteria bacterium]
MTHHSSLITAFIALGSNLEDPEQQIGRGLLEIAALPDTRLARVSSLYRSAPVGYHDQPHFVNAVAAVETSLAPRALLDHLLAIERGHGRVRGFPNAPRTLDLDIILYGDLALQEPGLAIPHPRMHERAFVLVPLVEIAPEAAVPGRGRASDLLQGVDAASVTRLAPAHG